jgi:hypothetical protein
MGMEHWCNDNCPGPVSKRLVTDFLSYGLTLLYYLNIMACRPIARQPLKKKQLYNGCYLVMASQTSMRAQQQLETAVHAELL